MSDLTILPIGELITENLAIPNYQRPYKWTKESAALLFNDIYTAFTEHLPEYRIGSIILHKENDTYNIVDGQQRITTLIILLYCISKEFPQITSIINNLSLLKDNLFDELSLPALLDNYEILRNKCLEIKGAMPTFTKYLLKQCTFVKIITKSEQEAFQFFDSQNSRGKELAPHDLLKSYHLREMKYDNESFIINIINNWEGTNQKELKTFFASTLYPLVNWYKGKDGLNYSTKEIKSFKGIKQSNSFNFSVYHKASNLYIEHYNQQEMYELSNGEKPNQFQLTQPIIAGRRFFQYTLHYFNLYSSVNTRVENLLNSKGINNGGVGNSYIKNLYINACLFFIDKFNNDALTERRFRRLFVWAYSLRLVMYAVYPETINKYALGINERLNEGINLFSIINEMQTPEELDLILLHTVTTEEMEKYKTNNNKYDDLFKAIMEMKQ